MITWKKIGKNVNSECTTITYKGEGTRLLIQSRKRHIPHANGIGTCDHTTYWVMDNGKEVKQLYTLKEAKEFAEGYYEANYMTKAKLERTLALAAEMAAAKHAATTHKTKSRLQQQLEEMGAIRRANDGSDQ